MRIEMRKLLVVLLLLFVEIIGIVSISNATGRKEKTQFHAGSEYSKPLVSFTENKGQITDQQYQPRKMRELINSINSSHKVPHMIFIELI
jgi:hypothetical protein